MAHDRSAMTFETEIPFFPYREPSDQREGETRRRRLRVFVSATERVALVPPPISIDRRTRVPVPIDLGLLLGALLWWAVRRRRVAQG